MIQAIFSNVSAFAAVAFVLVSIVGFLVVLFASLFGLRVDAQVAGMLSTILTASLGIIGGAAAATTYERARATALILDLEHDYDEEVDDLMDQNESLVAQLDEKDAVIAHLSEPALRAYRETQGDK